MRGAALVCLCFLPVLACADEVLLKGGGKVAGVIVERTESSIVIEVGPGLVTVPLARVASVREGPSALASYRERASHLNRGDAAGWLALAAWARQQDLLTQSRDAYARVLATDPDNGEANEALGHVLLGKRWVSAEEGYRAAGLLPFDGRWVTPAEHEALLREQAEDAATARAEADARAREAEARAREAEAQAQAAAAEAQQAAGYGGIAMGYAGFGVPYGFFPRARRLHHGLAPLRPIRPMVGSALPPRFSNRGRSTPSVRTASSPPGAIPRRTLN
jgi:hypothetical protein